MPKLTKTLVERAEVKNRPYFLFDDTLAGFCVRILSTGKRHYYVQYLKHKKVKRIAIGRHGLLTVKQARDQAVALLGEIKGGADPQQECSDKRKEPLFEDITGRFMKEHAALHCKPRTRKSYAWLMKKHILPYFKEQKITDVTKADIAHFQHALRATPTSANHCLQILSKIFNLSEMWGLRPDASNPCRHIKQYPSKGCERYLSKQEAKRLGEVLQEIKSYPDENLSAVYCIQLLLLTGCRLGEIQTLKWDYVDEEHQVLRLPDSKTGAKLVYLGSGVTNLLEEIRHHPLRPQDNPYVIWGKKPGTCLQEIQKPWRRFRKMADLEDMRIHDLRHSFASFAVSKGMSLPMLGKLLGHSQVQTTARYAHLMAEPLTQAASEVTTVLGNLIQVDTKSQKQNLPVATLGISFIPGTRIEAPTFLTSDQAAAYLGIKPRLMENWRWRKVGPTFAKVGHRIRYNLNDLERFVTASSAEQTNANIH